MMATPPKYGDCPENKAGSHSPDILKIGTNIFVSCFLKVHTQRRA